MGVVACWGSWSVGVAESGGRRIWGLQSVGVVEGRNLKELLLLLFFFFFFKSTTSKRLLNTFLEVELEPKTKKKCELVRVCDGRKPSASGPFTKQEISFQLTSPEYE